MTNDYRPGTQFHTRRNSLTEHDIEDIIMAIESRQSHACRFKGVTEEDFYESVRFFKIANTNLTSGKNIIMKTFLVLLITFLFGMLGAGILGKIKGP